MCYLFPIPFGDDELIDHVDGYAYEWWRRDEPPDSDGPGWVHVVRVRVGRVHNKRQEEQQLK